jgi:HEXXH motif-containing protein
VNVPHHRLTHEMFGSLAAGGSGPDAIQELIAAEFSAHTLLLAGVVRAAQGGAQSRRAETGYDLLTAAWRADRAAAEAVIRHPSVGVWARQAIQTGKDAIARPGAEPGMLCAVAAAAAIRARLPIEVEVPAPGGRVVLPSLGAATVTGNTARIRVTDAGRAEVDTVGIPRYPYRDASGWRGLRRIQAGRFDVLIDTVDPFRMPDLPDLTSRVNFTMWDGSLRQTWRVLEAHHQGVAAEVAAAVSVIVPRTSPPSGVVSTTSSHAFGAIGMSLPPNPVSGAETFAHEVQHLKLGALQKIVALTLRDDGARYYAPWRDDPRPLDALLQGTYAYLGVSGFWRRQRRLEPADQQAGADAQYARWRSAAALSAETLRTSGRLTTAGADFVGGMAHVLAEWESEAIPADAQTRAHRAAEAHLTQWQSAHGGPRAR